MESCRWKISRKSCVIRARQFSVPQVQDVLYIDSTNNQQEKPLLQPGVSLRARVSSELCCLSRYFSTYKRVARKHVKDETVPSRMPRDDLSSHFEHVDRARIVYVRVFGKEQGIVEE